MDQLACQGFAGSHVGVGFYPHAAFGDPAALFDSRFDALEQFRIVLLAVGVSLGLALQEFVTRVFFDQAQLGGKCAGDFPLSLCQRPKPCHVEMGVADAVERGGCAAVDTGKRFFQDLPAFFIVGDAAFQGLLKVYGKGEFFQCFADLRGAQAAFRQAGHHFGKGDNVHPKLISVLVPNAESVFAHFGPQLAFQRVGIRAGDHRAGAAAFQGAFRIEMPSVGFRLKQICFSGFAVFGEDVVLHKMMGNRYPSGAVGAERVTVDKQGRFAAGIQIQHDHLAFRFGRKDDLAFQPHVFPFVSPRGALGNRRVAAVFQRLLGADVVVGLEAFKGNISQWAVEVLCQCNCPVPQTVMPFGCHFHEYHLLNFEILCDVRWGGQMDLRNDFPFGLPIK